MCSEIDHLSSLLILRSMSGDCDRQIFPADISETPDSPPLKIDVPPQSADDERETERENLEDHHQPDQLPEEIKGETHRDLEEGYETPTSSDHRIPTMTQCPPPPMKPRPPPPKLLKRKLSPPPRSIQLEVESIFSPIADDEAQQRKSKRARTADDEDRS